MSNTPIPSEYLYTLKKPSVPPPKKRGWVIAAVVAALVLLLCLCALLLPRREAAQPWEPGTHTGEALEETLEEPDGTDQGTESADGSHAPEEDETVDLFGLYDGNVVYVNDSFRDKLYFADHPLFTDGEVEEILGADYRSDDKTWISSLPSSELSSSNVPPVRYNGDFGFMDAATVFYKNSAYLRETEELLYHTYETRKGHIEFDYSPEGRFVGFRFPDSCSDPAPLEEAIPASKEFLLTAGAELTADHAPYTDTACTCVYDDANRTQSRLTRVWWVRRIGGTVADGYLVYCMSDGNTVTVKQCYAVSEGLYDAYSYITEEQIAHTRARLLEAISHMEGRDYGDSEHAEGCEKDTLILGVDGNLYLRIHAKGLYVGSGEFVYAYMRVNP